MEVGTQETNRQMLSSVHSVTIESNASGKAIIVGEHAVVYGASAVALPLTTMPAQFRLKELGDRTSQSPSSRLMMQGELMSDEISAIIDEALELIGKNHYYAIIEGFSHLPIGAGLGASASLAIGILRVLCSCFEIKLEKKNLAVLGNQLEKRFHGTPSGLDTAVVSYEETIRFKRPNLIEPVEITPLLNKGMMQKWPFVLIDSGVRSPTKEMIEIAKPYFNGDKGIERIQQFDVLADEVCDAFGHGDFDKMVSALNQAAKYLNDAGVMTAALIKIKNICESLNIPAVKPTGAGGGGCMLALLDPNKDSEQLKELKKTFGSHFIYEVYIG